MIINIHQIIKLELARLRDGCAVRHLLLPLFATGTNVEKMFSMNLNCIVCLIVCFFVV